MCNIVPPMDYQIWIKNHPSQVNKNNYIFTWNNWQYSMRLPVVWKEQLRSKVPVEINIPRVKFPRISRNVFVSCLKNYRRLSVLRARVGKQVCSGVREPVRRSHSCGGCIMPVSSRARSCRLRISSNSIKDLLFVFASRGAWVPDPTPHRKRTGPARSNIIYIVYIVSYTHSVLCTYFVIYIACIYRIT